MTAFWTFYGTIKVRRPKAHIFFGSAGPPIALQADRAEAASQEMLQFSETDPDFRPSSVGSSTIQDILPIMSEEHIAFTASVPFARFSELLDSIRHRTIQRTGRLTRPEGKLTLTMSADHAVRHDLLGILDSLQKAA